MEKWLVISKKCLIFEYLRIILAKKLLEEETCGLVRKTNNCAKG